MSATWKIDAYALQRLLAGIERPWHGGRLLFGWSLFQSTAVDDGEVVASATNCGEPCRHF